VKLRRAALYARDHASRCRFGDEIGHNFIEYSKCNNLLNLLELLDLLVKTEKLWKPNSPSIAKIHAESVCMEHASNENQIHESWPPSQCREAVSRD